LVLLEVWNLSPRDLFSQGNLFFLGAAICWSVLTVVSQNVQRRVEFLAYSFYVNLVCTALNLAVLVPRGFALSPARPVVFWGGLGYLAVVGTAFATTVYFLASRRLGAHRAGSFIFLVPTFAVFLSWLLLGERPDAATLAGGAITLVAVYLINSRDRPPVRRGDRE
jgi:drug/metabolite transporter (DMT)-like permease